MKRKSVVQKLNLAFAAVAITAVIAVPGLQSAYADVVNPTPVPGASPVLPDVNTPAITEDKAGKVVEIPPDSILAVNNDPSTVTNESFFQSLGSAIGGIKGQSTLAIVLIVAQLLIQFTKTSIFGNVFTKVAGDVKLMIVAGLTIVTTVVPLVIQGMGWLAALTSGAVMTAVMVFGNQVYQHFFSNKQTVKV